MKKFVSLYLGVYTLFKETVGGKRIEISLVLQIILLFHFLKREIYYILQNVSGERDARKITSVLSFSFAARRKAIKYSITLAFSTSDKER